MVVGASLWARDIVSDKWSFAEFDEGYLENWPWLEHRNEGMWAVLGEAVRAYYRITA